jgi:hypothetical protein
MSPVGPVKEETNFVNTAGVWGRSKLASAAWSR